MLPRRLAALALGALALATACTGSPSPGGALGPSSPSASASPDADESHPPIVVRDLTSAELQNRWWIWATSTESARNPVLDQDGRRCAQDQEEGIWLLAGTTGGAAERSCTVPTGVPVVFPLVNLMGDAHDCLGFMDAAKGGAVLDGKALTPEKLDATPIDMVTAAGNPFTGKRDHFHTWSCGLWVRLEPLSPGSHELSFHGESGSFSDSVDYHLQVAKPTPTGAA
ncbi:signal protein [Kitasatospora sp. NBC_00085]|uniref:signal protein n=1 Tax=unclassified Kitasatospora TaxID=2633591 RepID=UPI003244DFEB